MSETKSVPEHQFASATGTILCEACGATHESSAKYCAGCGANLYAPCVSCHEPVQTSHRYCVACGADVHDALRQRREELRHCVSDAVNAAKNHEYCRAISLLQEVAAVDDDRLAPIVHEANAAIAKIRDLQSRATRSAQKSLKRAQNAWAKGNISEVVDALKQAPEGSLVKEQKTTRESLRVRCDSVMRLDKDLRLAIKSKDWPRVGSLIDALTELMPGHVQYRELSKKVSVKLLAAASARLARARYHDARNLLNHVPGVARAEAYHKLLHRSETALWLKQQLEYEPFVTPTLGRLAIRLSRYAEADEHTEKLIQQITQRMKSGARPQRTDVPVWMADRTTWTGGDVTWLSRPGGVQIDGARDFEAYPAQFNVAIGLALQGLGQARITDDFLIRKTRLLGPFRGRAAAQCWGVDIGTSAVKAVKLVQEGAHTRVIDSFYGEYDAPLSRIPRAPTAGPADDAAECDVDELRAISPVISRWSEEKAIDGAPVWANISATHVVHRFVRLPPVKDKEAKQLLDQELKSSIPVAVEDLALVKSIARLDPEGHRGRPALIAAARRNSVQQRMDLLASLDLNVAGIQSDSLALVNFAAHEFTDELDDQECGQHANGKGELSSDLLNRSDLTDDRAGLDATHCRAIALVDCGATTTNLVLVTSESQWVWTFEFGGEDFTVRIANAIKVNRETAEHRKRNPAELEHPSSDYEGVEQRMHEMRSRMQNAFKAMRKQEGPVSIIETWCCGGGAQTLGWMRHVLCEPSRT